MMDFLGFTFAQWQEIGISLLVLAAAIVLGRWAIRRILLPVLNRISGRTETTLDDVLLEAVTGPAYWLLVVAAAQFAFGRIEFVQSRLGLQLDDIYFVLYLTIFFWLGWRVITVISEWLANNLSRDRDDSLAEQLMPFISRVALILFSVIVGIILLEHFNVEVSGLVATLGIGSLAIALAAQAALSDIISGFMIMIDRPFRIGDRIEILDLDTWGDVVDIGLRSSQVRTRDNRMVIVPNSVIGKSLIVNYSYPDSQYRIQVELPIGYDTDVEEARKVLIEAVSGVEGVLKEYPVEALFLHFGDDGMIFRVRWWLESYEDTRRMFDRVNTAMIKALEAAGIEIPNPEYELFHRVRDEDAIQIHRVINPKK